MAHLSWTPQLGVHRQRNPEMSNIVT